MARKRTGLRNRFRSGRGSYSINKKSRQSDMYGEYQNGKCQKPDIIAGHQLNATMPRTFEKDTPDPLVKLRQLV